jgi:protein TonB
MTVSGALHMALLLVFTIFPASPRHLDWESAPLVVSLVSLPAPAPEEPPKVTPKPREKAPQLPKEKPKKKPETPKEKPKEKPKPPKSEPKPVKQTPRTEVPDSLARQQPEAEALKVTARVDESQFVYDYYLQVVAGKISEVWEPPAGFLGEMGEIAAAVKFRILREGRVQAVEVESPSPVALFDRSAREAVLRAQPFPPLPPGYGGRWLTVHLRFVSGG